MDNLVVLLGSSSIHTTYILSSGESKFAYLFQKNQKLDLYRIFSTIINKCQLLIVVTFHNDIKIIDQNVLSKYLDHDMLNTIDKICNSENIVSFSWKIYRPTFNEIIEIYSSHKEPQMAVVVNKFNGIEIYKRLDNSFRLHLNFNQLREYEDEDIPCVLYELLTEQIDAGITNIIIITPYFLLEFFIAIKKKIEDELHVRILIVGDEYNFEKLISKHILNMNVHDVSDECIKVENNIKKYFYIYRWLVFLCCFMLITILCAKFFHPDTTVSLDEVLGSNISEERAYQKRIKTYDEIINTVILNSGKNISRIYFNGADDMKYNLSISLQCSDLDKFGNALVSDYKEQCTIKTDSISSPTTSQCYIDVKCYK